MSARSSAIRSAAVDIRRSQAKGRWPKAEEEAGNKQICFGLWPSAFGLPISAEHVVGQRNQSVALGGGRKRGDELRLGALAIFDGPLEGGLDGAMAGEQVLDGPPGLRRDVAVLDDALDHAGDVGTRALQQEDDRQRDFPLAQI